MNTNTIEDYSDEVHEKTRGRKERLTKSIKARTHRHQVRELKAAKERQS